jgi:hypothetical protein
VTVQTKSELLHQACREVEQHGFAVSKRNLSERSRDRAASDRRKKNQWKQALAYL